MPSKAFNLGKLALALAAALSFAPAQAGTATSHIEQFSYQLIDLNPNDGIAPAISFQAATESESMYALDVGTVLVSLDAIPSYGTTNAVGAIGSASTFSSPNRWLASASLNGDPTGSPTVYASTHDAGTFTLSASTRVVFTFSGTLHAAADEPTGAAHANVVIDSSLSVSPLESSHTLFYFLGDANLGGPATPFSYIGTLESAGQEAIGHLNIATTASTTLLEPWTPPPVPEPASYAMLLGGAALMAALRRRRN